jgi:putative protein kinase ArgK-like GTPase of G3E family
MLSFNLPLMKQKTPKVIEFYSDEDNGRMTEGFCKMDWVAEEEKENKVAREREEEKERKEKQQIEWMKQIKAQKLLEEVKKTEEREQRMKEKREREELEAYAKKMSDAGYHWNHNDGCWDRWNLNS